MTVVIVLFTFIAFVAIVYNIMKDTTVIESQTDSNSKIENQLITKLPSDYIIVDVETTGLDTFNDQIIEIGAIKYSEGEKVDEFSSLVKGEVSSFIVNLTGITNEMLEDAPPIKEVIKKFYDFIGNSILISYNARFDGEFLNYALVRNHYIKLANPYIDVLTIARNLLALKDYKQKTVAAHYKIQYNSHRAMNDCEACNQIYQLLKRDMYKKYNSEEDYFNGKKKPLTDIKSDLTSFNENHPLYKKVCVFSRSFMKPREDAVQMLVDVGGIYENNISERTNFLIVGFGDKTTKETKAEELITQGQDIKIISEDDFYKLINKKIKNT